MTQELKYPNDQSVLERLHQAEPELDTSNKHPELCSSVTFTMDVYSHIIEGMQSDCNNVTGRGITIRENSVS